MEIQTYIDKHLGTYIEWGQNDCYTFVAGWLFNKFPGIFLTRPKFNYSNKAGAIRVAQEFKWFAELNKIADLELIDNLENVQDGDILLAKSTYFECAHLINQKKAYSVSIIGFVGTPIAFFKHCKPQIIRVKGAKT